MRTLAGQIDGCPPGKDGGTPLFFVLVDGGSLCALVDGRSPGRVRRDFCTVCDSGFCFGMGIKFSENHRKL